MTTSPVRAAPVGMVLSAAVMVVIAYAVLRGYPRNSAADTRESESTSDASASTQRDPDLTRIAQADFWKPQSTTISHPSNDTQGQVPVAAQVPVAQPAVPSVPAAASPELSAEEAERDRLRHEAIEADLARQAADHAREVEAGAIAEAKGKVRIEMYGADWCATCRAAEAYLDASRVPYTLHNIERERGARETAHRLNPRHSIPVFQVDDDVVVGFGERSFEAAREKAARKRLGMPL